MAGIPGGSNKKLPKRYGASGKEISAGGAIGGFKGGDPSQGKNLFGGDPNPDTSVPWVQGGGTTTSRPVFNMNDLQMPSNPYAQQQSQQRARMTPSAQSAEISNIAQSNGRYSVGPYGALVSPNAPQINPATGAPTTPASGSGGFANYNSSMTASSGLGGAADYNAKYQEARNANLERYAEGKGELSSLRDRSMGYLEGAGQQEQADIRQSGDAAKAASGQKLQGLGLAGTTIGQTTNSGIDRETNDSLSRSNERINQQKLGTDAATTNNLTGFIERRTDAYPDMGVYAQLAMSEAANRGGGGESTGGAYGGANPQTGQQGGGQRAFINNSVGYGPITPSQRSGNPAPTGVNTEYMTNEAMLDPEYMKAFGNTKLKRAPRQI